MSTRIRKHYDPDVNDVPLYVEHLDDSLRFGSFVHCRFPDQEPNTTTIARLLHRVEDEEYDFCIRPYFPLFPVSKLKSHPILPEHYYQKIVDGVGACNIELYESDETYNCKSGDTDSPTVLFLAFVFTIKELSSPANIWGSGLKNVYVVRFREAWMYYNDDATKLVPIDNEGDKICFPNQHRGKKTFPHLVCKSRCHHESIWTGHFLLKKSLFKVLNKSGSQSALQDVDQCSIGHVPLEIVNYIALYSSTMYGITIAPNFFPSNESFVHLNSLLCRSKIRMTFEGGILRFQTYQELQMLRDVLGFSATYGTSERRPTLKDGTAGLSLKRGHFLTLVKGLSEDEPVPPFKKRTTQQRVDISFSKLNFKVVAGFERYRYDVLRSGGLRVPPPTNHLAQVLSGSLATIPDNESCCSVELDLNEDNKTLIQRRHVLVGDLFFRYGHTFEVIEVLPDKEPPQIRTRIMSGRMFDKSKSKEEQPTGIIRDVKDVIKAIREYS